MTERLAAHGGTKVRTDPFVPREHLQRRFGDAELAALAEVLRSGHLCRVFGEKTKDFEREAAEYSGVAGAVAVTSGTAAIHCALAAVGTGPGDEVVTSPITDMGSVIPILALNAVPVFADVDPRTYNVTAETIERVLTERTRAIVPVHLAGQSCVMGPILELAERHGLRVIEDCAQSYLSTYEGRPVGTMGDAGCFSMNDFKHITCGDGGFLVSDDEELITHARLFADKGYLRGGAIRNPSTFGFNYRITELQAAVASVQLAKLSSIIERRRAFGARLNELLDGIPGVCPPHVAEGVESSCWFYPFTIDPEVLGVGPETFAREVTAEGIPVTYPYLAMPVYLYDCMREQRIYGDTQCPFDCPRQGKNPPYAQGLCPAAEGALAEMMVLPVNEFLTEADARDAARALRKVCDHHLAERS